MNTEPRVVAVDYDESDQYDWDQADPRQHCAHGTFIGSWWGPDLMCGACEAGVPVVLDRYWKLQDAARRARGHSSLAIYNAWDSITSLATSIPTARRWLLCSLG